MEHSNCGDQCAFVKSGFCKCDKECPFYTETWWQQTGNPEPKMLKDCFPKRMTLEQNGLLHRHLALQSVVEDVRNRLSKIEMMLEILISQSKEFLLEKKEQQVDSGFKQIFRMPQEKPKELLNKIKKEGNDDITN